MIEEGLYDEKGNYEEEEYKMSIRSDVGRYDGQNILAYECCSPDLNKLYTTLSSPITWDTNIRGPKMSINTGRVIWKYQFPVKEEFILKLPVYAQILRVAEQDGFFWLWALVDTEADTEADIEERKFGAYKTGGTIPTNNKLNYIGCCPLFIQQELMLYIFEIMKDE